MKNFRNIAMIIAASVAIVSCNDAIDIVQDGEINPDVALTSVTNLENYLNGAVYNALDNSSAIKYTSLFTDELRIGPGNTGSDLANFRWIITPNNGYAAGIWSENYTTINRVNTLVAAAEKITPSSTEASKLNSTVAEARAIRALAYLNLMTYFSTDTKNENALGVMLPLKPMTITEVLPRVPNSEVWAAVESDLNFAYTNVGHTAGSPPVIQRPAPLFISKAGISAIRARMYLYRGNYTLAKQYAQQAITDFGIPMTAATPVPAGTPGSTAWNTAFYTPTGGTSPYRQMWVDTIPGENIFKLARPSTGTLSGIAALWTTNTTNFTGAVLWSTGLNLFSLYSNTPNDIRRYAFVDPTSEQNFYIIDKYPGKQTTPLRNDIKLFRVTEMQLILAECAANGSPTDLTTAATIIRNIRQARMMSGTAILPVYTNVQAALRDILIERRVELAFEGHRFIDLKRLGTAAGVGISRNAGDDRINSSTPLTLNLTDYRWTLPIPASEINGNPGIQQNPGY
ncbi:RagB/SusD family nutrient uptake outer membrane protein [Chryseobacterium indoltheticum]|uniref:RagB/SusD family nutrient uptake outer membrane protein n=1 Tax=Chryseobacterium indoltheticum TaxID=254 RepID=UPI0040433360